MNALYDVYYRGELLDDQDRDTVRSNLQRLFKADETTLDRLFSGKTQVLKRGCDKATALKYKQAMERAGARPLIRERRPETAAAQAAHQSDAVESGATAAQREARQPPDAGEQPSAAIAATRSDGGSLQLAPPGTAVLEADERAPVVQRDIDTSHLHIAGQDIPLGEGERQPAPSPPDTGHLSLGAVGEPIPTLRPAGAPAAPDISAIELCPPGTDFSDCHSDTADIDIDTSAIELAPPDSVLSAGRQRPPPGDPPATDHLSVEPPGG
jgi:hypothetical protein